MVQLAIVGALHNDSAFRLWDHSLNLVSYHDPQPSKSPSDRPELDLPLDAKGEQSLGTNDCLLKVLAAFCLIFNQCQNGFACGDLALRKTLKHNKEYNLPTIWLGL